MEAESGWVLVSILPSTAWQKLRVPGEHQSQPLPQPPRLAVYIYIYPYNGLIAWQSVVSFKHSTRCHSCSRKWFVCRALQPHHLVQSKCQPAPRAACHLAGATQPPQCTERALGVGILTLNPSFPNKQGC